MSGAYPAIVMQMLAYSDDGLVELLPALPASWQHGKMQGMSLRGGIRLDALEWDDSRCTATFVSKRDQSIQVSVGRGSAQMLTLKAGQASTVTLTR